MPLSEPHPKGACRCTMSLMGPIDSGYQCGSKLECGGKLLTKLLVHLPFSLKLPSNLNDPIQVPPSASWSHISQSASVTSQKLGFLCPTTWDVGGCFASLVQAPLAPLEIVHWVDCNLSSHSIQYLRAWPCRHDCSCTNWHTRSDNCSGTYVELKESHDMASTTAMRQGLVLLGVQASQTHCNMKRQ